MDPFSFCCYAIVLAIQAACVAPSAIRGQRDGDNNDTYFAG
jgi:hypothetical protein